MRVPCIATHIAHLNGCHGDVLLAVDLLVAQEPAAVATGTLEVVVSGTMAAAAPDSGTCLTTHVTPLGRGRGEDNKVTSL